MVHNCRYTSLEISVREDLRKLRSDHTEHLLQREISGVFSPFHNPHRCNSITHRGI